MKPRMDVMSWYYHVVVKKLAENRNRFWYKLLANRSFSQEGSWFWEGSGTFECETIYVVPFEFIYKGNIELHECPVKIWNYSRFVWPFLYII